MHPSNRPRRSVVVERLLIAGGILLSLLAITSYTIYTVNLHSNDLQKIRTYIPGLLNPAPTKPIVTCTTPQHKLGDTTISLPSAGLTRTFVLHLPPSYGIQPQALVINYHGYNFTAPKMEQYTNMAVEADKAGFIVVFPQGVDNPPSWNAGIGAYGPTGDADDVQFTRDMFSYLEKSYCVDTHRIYVTGFSLGGGLAYRIACTLTKQIAAFATVAGAFYHAPGGCQPSRPIPVLEIHGQADRYAPYDGNPSAMMAAVSVYLNVWLSHDQCSGSPDTIFQQGDVTGLEWKHCAKGTVVEHYRISDGGHVWPGGGNIADLGFSTHVIDANVVIWNFLSQYTT